MEIKEEPIEKPEEEPEKKPEEEPTGDKPKSIIPYMDKIRIRELYGYDWTKFDIAGNLTEAQKTDLTDGGATTLHKHDHGGMDGLGDDDHTQYYGSGLREPDHGALGGLADDDHTQYHNNTRGDARYLYKENTSAFTPDGDYEPCTKKYADDIVGGITSVATGFESNITPTDASTTDLTIGFTPKIIFFYAVAYTGSGQGLSSSGISKGTADADNTVTYMDAEFGKADSNDGKCIQIFQNLASRIAGKVTTLGSTTTITWEVITSTTISFSWTALA